jgi:hypothetical protein
MRRATQPVDGRTALTLEKAPLEQWEEAVEVIKAWCEDSKAYQEGLVKACKKLKRNAAALQHSVNLHFRSPRDWEAFEAQSERVLPVLHQPA